MAAEYSATGALIKEYHFNPQMPWMTDPQFMRTADGKVYYYRNDQLGTPQQLLDASGQIVWAAIYSAFGKASISKELVENNLRFPGQYFDAETGLQYNYFRDYDPEVGRYLQSDPIGLIAGSNTYTYAYASPLNLFDPDGLCPWCAGAVVGAVLDLGLQLLNNGGNFRCVDWGSVVSSAALGALGGGLTSKAFVKRPGTVWSHWVPDRYIRPLTKSGKGVNSAYKPWVPKSFVNSRFNGNYVSPYFHYLTDPKATMKGMSKDGKFSKPLQQLLRLPGWIPGAAAFGGAAAKGAGKGASARADCGCQAND